MCPIRPIEPMSHPSFLAAPTLPLDLEVWNSWIDQGRAEERHRAAVRLKAVKWVSGFILLSCALFWPLGERSATFVRFAVSGGALVVMLRAFREGHPASLVSFAALAILFNPIVPVFHFGGEWSRSLMIAAAIPFLGSLGWRRGRVNSAGTGGSRHDI